MELTVFPSLSIDDLTNVQIHLVIFTANVHIRRSFKFGIHQNSFPINVVGLNQEKRKRSVGFHGLSTSFGGHVNSTVGFYAQLFLYDTLV